MTFNKVVECAGQQKAYEQADIRAAEVVNRQWARPEGGVREGKRGHDPEQVDAEGAPIDTVMEPVRPNTPSVKPCSIVVPAPQPVVHQQDRRPGRQESKR